MFNISAHISFTNWETNLMENHSYLRAFTDWLAACFLNRWPRGWPTCRHKTLMKMFIFICINGHWHQLPHTAASLLSASTNASRLRDGLPFALRVHHNSSKYSGPGTTHAVHLEKFEQGPGGYRGAECEEFASRDQSLCKATGSSFQMAKCRRATSVSTAVK